MKPTQQTTFAPMLAIESGVTDISFYEKTFGAVVFRRFNNDDGSLHVAEMLIDGAPLRLHEDNPSKGIFAPCKCHGVTTTIGLIVADVDKIMASALSAGATEISPAQDYDYGYRQGEIKDPFGHHWLIETKI